MRGFRTLRQRLTLGYAGLLAAAFALYAAAVFGVLRRHTYSRLDLDLHQEIELAAQRLGARPDGSLSWRGGAGLENTDEEPGGARSVEVWSRDGRRLLSAVSGDGFGGASLPPIVAGETTRHLVVQGGLHVQTQAHTSTIDGVPVIIRAAVSEEPARRQVLELLIGLALAVPAAVAVFGLAGHAVAGRLLRPVTEMVERSRRITAERLQERLPVADPDDELGMLATSFNSTLARLELSFEQLRRFTADASHELRTPLTALCTVGEVGLRRRHDEAGYKEIIGSMLEEAEHLTRLVDGLLRLARAEAGEVRLRLEELDLAELARDVCTQLSVLAEERRQELVVEGHGAVPLAADATVLRQVVTNLIDNAVQYGAEGTQVSIRVDGTAEAAVLEVTDHGPGIAEEHRPRVFDRFYRVDPSRSRRPGGSGLGLSFVKWAVEAHRGRVELESDVGVGSTFRVILPRSPTGVRGTGGRACP